MSLRARLVGAITFVLVGVLLAGSVLTYWHAQRKVDIEMSAAMEVARNTVLRRMEELSRSFRPQEHLEETISIFDGDRHLEAALVDRTGREIAHSRVAPPPHDVPDWFLALVAPDFETERIDVPSIPAPIGAVLLIPDPRSEVDEVWADVQITLSVLGGFFLSAFLFISVIIDRALGPIGALSDAFQRIGAGDYGARLSPAGSPELARLCLGCNEMAERLGDMDARNRSLAEQLVRLQDEERAEIARDLHDEVGPVLFAIDVDAAAIETLSADAGGGPRSAEIVERARAARRAASHARTHVRGMLGQLRPGVLGSLGLAAAVREIASFQRDHHPGVAFVLDVPEASFGAAVDTAILSVVREAVNNALKHAAPRKVEISIVDLGGEAVIRVVDDGRGLGEGGATGGYGLVGMRERFVALGGSLKVGTRPGGAGVTVEGLVPTGSSRATIEETSKGRAA